MGTPKKEKGKTKHWSLMDEYTTKEMLIYLEDLKRKGCTDSAIADKIGITVRTLINWKNKDKRIRDAIKNGKYVSIAQMANAVFLAGIGHVEKVPTVLKDKQSGIPLVRNKDGEIGLMTGEEGEEIITYEDLVYIKPDVKAMMFYLANRCSEEWGINRTYEGTNDKNMAQGVVEVVVRNEGLEELEKKAIEEAKKKDEELEKKGTE